MNSPPAGIRHNRFLRWNYAKADKRDAEIFARARYVSDELRSMRTDWRAPLGRDFRDDLANVGQRHGGMMYLG